jgi:hypothetical protein
VRNSGLVCNEWQQHSEDLPLTFCRFFASRIKLAVFFPLLFVCASNLQSLQSSITSCKLPAGIAGETAIAQQQQQQFCFGVLSTFYFALLQRHLEQKEDVVTQSLQVAHPISHSVRS